MLTRLVLLGFRLFKAGSLLLGTVLVIVLVLEGSARVALRFLAPAGDAPLSSEPPEIYRPVGPAGIEWRPHVYWRARPRSGPHVNVDEDGLRATWNPPDAASEALQVHMFGASTLRGHGARDDYTIPSLVSKIVAARRPGPVVFTNFGQKAYSTTQDVLALLFELQRGHVPDLAVFYDGSLDIESSYDIGAAGSPRNEHLRRMAFQDHKAYVWLQILKRSSFAKLVLLYVDGWDWEIAGVWVPPASPDAFPRLAEGTVRVYAANVDLARALGRAYGFEVLHFWPPVLWSKHPMTPDEQRMVTQEARKHPMKGDLFERTYAQVEANSALQSDPRFEDLQGAFDGTDVAPFFDPTHTTEAGNAVVAQRIAAAVLAALERRDAGADADGPGTAESTATLH